MVKPFLRKTLRRPRYLLEDVFKIPSYHRPQSFDVDYSVRLTNVSSMEQKFSLILPVPTDNEQQTIVKRSRFEPSEVTLQPEIKYNNKFAVWQVALEKGETASFHELFSVTIQPIDRDEVLKKTYSRDEYRLSAVSQGQYLKPNRFLGSDDSRIKKLAQALLVQNNVARTVRNINEFVIQYLEYKNPILGLYGYKEALETKAVDCGGFDSLFVSLCQALGIPARIVSGFFVGRVKNTMHAWCEWMLPDGVWIPADPSVEQQYRRGEAKKSAYFGFCGSNRIIFSYGCDLSLLLPATSDQPPATLSADILQNPLLHPPLASIDMDILLKTTPLTSSTSSP